ncbi:hypothetical protein Pcinc_040680 [Petrolisthes cinctipes]|uniref:Uncharacterized protein n=1 Tax=Petrolisthes cinctipes TaxID=88211 RepID=A0AAE1EKK6_PETCI|nr:hypothetical protein Pcinc_040680 [Petrolisthes cinctipes]
MITSSNQPSVVHACPASTHPPREYHPQKDKNVKTKSYLGTYVTHTCKPSCQLTSYQADIPSRICSTCQNREVSDLSAGRHSSGTTLTLQCTKDCATITQQS